MGWVVGNCVGQVGVGYCNRSPKALFLPCATVDFPRSGVTPVLSLPRVPTGIPPETHGNRLPPPLLPLHTRNHQHAKIAGLIPVHFMFSIYLQHLPPTPVLPTFLFIPSPITQFERQSVRLQVRCLLFSSRTRISPFYRYLSGYKYVARSLPHERAFLLSTAICPSTGALLALCLCDAHLSFPLLSVLLQVRCSLSASPTRISPFCRNLSSYRCVPRSLRLRRASLLSTAICPATGALPVLYLSDAHLPFQLLASYPATGALPALYLSDVHLFFPPPSVLLQVHCTLSTSPMRISPFHRYLSCYRCIARSLPL